MENNEIKKALECCKSDDMTHCRGCPYDKGIYCMCDMSADALSLINELTEENKAWQKQLIAKEEKADKAYYELACEVEDLRAENENLHASCTELTRKCASLTEENDKLTRNLKIANLQIECKERILESYMLQYGTVADKEVFLKKERADTVREMQERLCEGRVSNDNVVIVANQIAKEMLEDEI